MAKLYSFTEQTFIVGKTPVLSKSKTPGRSGGIFLIISYSLKTLSRITSQAVRNVVNVAYPMAMSALDAAVDER